MLVRLEYISDTTDGHIFKEPISGSILVLTTEQANEIAAMYNDLRDIIDAVGRLGKGAEGPPKVGQGHKGQLTLPGLPPKAQGPDSPQETALTALHLASEEPGQAPKPETPTEPEIEGSVQQDDWLFGENVDKESLPFRVNDDAEPKEDRMAAVIETLSRHYGKLDETQMRKVAEHIANINVHDRVKHKDALPEELKQMVVQIVLSRDGLNSSHVPAAEAVFLGHGSPDFGLNKEAPPASIPKGFGETALGPTAKYRSAESLAAMLKGTSEPKSDS